jgi:hypothetical protein
LGETVYHSVEDYLDNNNDTIMLQTYEQVEDYLSNNGHKYKQYDNYDELSEILCKDIYNKSYDPNKTYSGFNAGVYRAAVDFIDGEFDLDESCNKKSVKEGYHSNSEEYEPFFPEDYQLIDEQTANFFIQTTKVLQNGNQIGYIQKHPKRGGTRKTDNNRVRDTYYVAIRDGAGQSMVDTPEEAVKFILGKSEAIKESAFNAEALRRFQDRQRNK